LLNSHSENLTLNGIRYHVRIWGEPNQPTFFLLHGWMDLSASFQFLIDALKNRWQVIAPDLRGFGPSGWAGGAYYFPDYFADLDRLLDHYSPNAPVNLVGHSMGGNIAGLYAGIRPQRVAQLALLEGFGLKPTDPASAPERFAKWLDQLKAPPGFKAYGNIDEFARRLQQNNPRLTTTRAQFIAAQSCKETAPGKFELISDPSHKLTNPVLYRIEEAKACWQRITAPCLWITGANSEFMRMQITNPEDYAARKACFNNLRETIIPDCGHMMHWDQPDALAASIEEFFQR
jgi:pimeloyl-ACP methyl ester carboxylesterase